MIEAVFISDLHLHPDEQLIRTRFNEFISWARGSVKKVYILGDLFYAWSGDDAINEWSREIANQLNTLKLSGVETHYLHGNRDFLLGKQFADLAGFDIISDPTVIHLGGEKVLLAHGDHYCTNDKAHQSFRLLTRNKWFARLFLLLPLNLRRSLVEKVRQQSQSNQSKSKEQMDVVDAAFTKEMHSHSVATLIHGHTHKPGLNCYDNGGVTLKRYVLSDWDDNPQLLCYDNTKGIYFAQM